MSLKDDNILALMNFQSDLGNRINKAKSNFKKSPKERITKEYVEGRLENLEQVWFEFLSGHKQIMTTVKPKELSQSDYLIGETYDKVEEVYLDYKCELKSVLKTFTSHSKEVNQTNNSQTSAEGLKGFSYVKLPKINIPSFSGNYSEWPTFRDLFDSLVHSHEYLSKVQKLHYLKGYLLGEAELLLRHIPIVESNYDRCWQILKDRYNNKKYLCHTILKKLFSFKNLASESASGLKDLIDNASDCLAALNNIGIDTNSWDVIIVYILTLKLDPESRRHWEFSVTDSRSSEELPTYEQFKDFITGRYRAIEFLDSTTSSYHRNQTHSMDSKLKSLHTASVSCSFCAEDHKLSYCKRFANETLDSRRKYVQLNNLCFNCLGNNHSAKTCNIKFRCRICKRKHHSLLHPNGSSADGDGSQDVGATSSSKRTFVVTSGESEEELDSSDPVVSCFATGRSSNQVLLATALVKANCRNGEQYVIRALLDQGSQSSFVTESTVQYLGLKKTAMRGQISGLGGNKNIVSKAMVTIELTSIMTPNFTIKVQAYVLESITSFLPSNRIGLLEWSELQELTLADPHYHTPSRIDLLLGAEVYGKVLLDGVKKGPLGSLVAQSTSLGWILSGAVSSTTRSNGEVNVMHCCIQDNDLLKKFWEIEADFNLDSGIMKEEDKYCEKFFEETTVRDKDGRYIVRLPFKAEKLEVSNSCLIAKKRWKSLEYRLDKNESLKNSYKEVMCEYLSLKHMELIPENEIVGQRAIYLPHHAVVREDKETTRVRVVFDASMKGQNGKSLNDNLFIGPTLQPDLRHIIIRWRAHPVCLTADIVKMYRQVRVNSQDVDNQRVLWRENTESAVDHYRLLTVTFGTACAPYLAVKSLQQVAKDEGKSYPLASERVMMDFYMDDLLTGCQTIKEGLNIYKEMNELLSKGGFELQKWTSNRDDLIKNMQKIKLNRNYVQNYSESNKENVKIKTDDIIKIVGLNWNRNDDSFHYSIELTDLHSPITKRKIISDISRFYDPLGWVAPSIIISKIIIQRLWLAGLGWDEAVPDHLLTEWLTYRQELRALSEVRIPRWITTRITDKLVELHGFCDASKLAYAAVIYCRVMDVDGRVHVSLIAAKTRVAPVKQVSIPRLELCGAVMVTKLITEVAKVMKIDKCNLHLWTDSTVVLAWLNSHPSRWKVFVANRVSEIVSTLDSHHWSHVGSKENPADVASRGLQPCELIGNDMWFKGPLFLYKDRIDYCKAANLITEIEMVKVHCAVVRDEAWQQFSSITKTIRVMAYCRRFVHNAKVNARDRYFGSVTTKELVEVMNLLIRACQGNAFEVEINIIKRQENLSKGSSLRFLNPFLDKDDLLRVGGRLDNTTLSFNRKHPIILPKKSHLTDLIIADAHKQTLHGGPQSMLYYIQGKYWILSAKQLVRSHFRKCVICVKNKAVTQSQLMGQLPAVRVTPTRPFKCSGVDYAGPIQIRTAKGRGHKSHKGYICLFVCMVTRAVHLEVVTDLSSEGFLQAFKRFVSRRGYCSEIWSDNATNFVGAAAELKKLFLNEKGRILSEIADSLATNGCSWHFIPAQSPHFGGLWEAGVKSVKYHLKRTIGLSTLTYEEMATVLAQVEACLNSRPQSVINDSIDDLTVLTPGHFLVGESLVVPPDYNYEKVNVSSLRRWQHTQRMVQDFWTKWSREYLTKYYQRYRWSSQNPQPKIDDIVVVKEDGLPPCRWLYGRVIETHPGADGLVRVVTLRMKNGTFKRPITKLCLLPIAE